MFWYSKKSGINMICGKTLRDSISNETICDMAGVKIRVLKRVEIVMVWTGGKDGWRKKLPFKQKICSWRFKKRPTIEKLKVVTKDVHGKGLKRTDAPDRSLWRLGCKNQLTPAWKENTQSSSRMKRFFNTSVTNGWWQFWSCTKTFFLLWWSTWVLVKNFLHLPA